MNVEIGDFVKLKPRKDCNESHWLIVDDMLQFFGGIHQVTAVECYGDLKLFNPHGWNFTFDRNWVESIVKLDGEVVV